MLPLNSRIVTWYDGGVKRIKVVAGIIVKDRKVLVAKRRPEKRLGGTWEFPGGKLEAGETPETALMRELFEEFSIRTRTGALLGVSVYHYPEFEIELLAYWSEHLSGEFALTDHDEIRWAAPDELSKLNLAPADVPFVKLIQEANLSQPSRRR